MNSGITAVPNGDKLPPSVVGGCFDLQHGRMWLAFEDATAAYYPKVPRTVLRRLQSCEGPKEATEYLQTHVLGIIESNPIDYGAYSIAEALGMQPPTE